MSMTNDLLLVEEGMGDMDFIGVDNPESKLAVLVHAQLERGVPKPPTNQVACIKGTLTVSF